MTHVNTAQLRLIEAFNWLKVNRKLRQKHIADRMGTSETTVSRNVRAAGDGRVNMDFLIQFNNTFGNIFNLEYIVNGEGSLINEPSKPVASPSQQNMPAWANNLIEIMSKQIAENEKLHRELTQALHDVSLLQRQLHVAWRYENMESETLLAADPDPKQHRTP